ncbi:MAG: hypothetical protein QM648_11430 [Solirubrobacterales bacterium]
MSRERDTDTLTPTRFDHTPDMPTVRQEFSGSDEATHQVDPRNWAPLRVCPECSLAWEITGEWCPSCGTAFEKSRREASTPTRVMPRRPAAEPPLSRSARRRSSGGQLRPRAEAPAPPSGPPKRAAKPKSSAGSFFKGVFVVVGLCAAMAIAFLAGQASRPTNAQIDSRIAQAVDTAKQSASRSYGRAFEKMQARAAAAAEAARKQGQAEGAATAEQQLADQQQDNQGIFDSVTACVLHGNC